MQRCLSTANRSISCKTSRRCSSLFLTKRHLYMDAGDALRAGNVFRDWLALEQTVLHDGKADANRKGFDGRDVAPGECAPWCLHTSRGAQFSGERLPVFATIYSRFRPDQMGGRTGQSRSGTRSEEHTSELQSPYDLVCRLLLEKKKNIK